MKYVWYQYFSEIQIEADAGSLTIYDGGSENAEIIGTLTSAINDTKISTPRNQIFVVLDKNRKNNSSIRLNATVFKSKLLYIIDKLDSVFLWWIPFYYFL